MCKPFAVPNSIQTVVSIQWAPIQKHSEYANIHRCRRSGKIKHGLNVASLMLVVGRSKFSYCYNNNNIVGWMNQKKKKLIRSSHFIETIDRIRRIRYNKRKPNSHKNITREIVQSTEGQNVMAYG